MKYVTKLGKLMKLNMVWNKMILAKYKSTKP
jgi:hypothetical protein